MCGEHGGGPRCEEAGCSKLARSKSAMCGEHGGGARCQEAGCGSMALRRSRMCGEHGGGPRCEEAGCSKLALSKSAMCGEHGGGARCQEAGCSKLARNKTGKCKRHTSKTKAKHRASGEASEPQVTDEVKQHAVNEAVGKLTGDAASRGLRPTGHITSISDDVKARIQKEIDLFEEKRNEGAVCARAATNFARRCTRSSLLKNGWSA